MGYGILDMSNRHLSDAASLTGRVAQMEAKDWHLENQFKQQKKQHNHELLGAAVGAGLRYGLSDEAKAHTQKGVEYINQKMDNSRPQEINKVQGAPEQAFAATNLVNYKQVTDYDKKMQEIANNISGPLGSLGGAAFAALASSLF